MTKTFSSMHPACDTSVRLAARDIGWAYAFPQQSRKQGPIVHLGAPSFPWAGLRRAVWRFWQATAHLRPAGQVRLAGQAQDFSDLFQAASPFANGHCPGQGVDQGRAPSCS